jgi:signal transduction histidine kinase
MSSDLYDSGVILHEISNIAMVIQSGARLMEKAKPNTSDALLASRTVTQGTQRLGEALVALKSLLGGQAGASVEVEQSVLTFVRDFAGDGVMWQGKQKLIRVTGDSENPERFNPDMLRMALRNFVANALNHSLAGSLIDIRVKHTVRETRISVRNYGNPIPDDIRACLFQPGCTGHGPGSGVGLGLHIAQRCAHALAGTIRYRSLRSQTVFSLILPTRWALTASRVPSAASA